MLIEPSNLPENIPSNPMINFDKLVHGLTSDSHSEPERVRNLNSFKCQINDYVNALQRAHQAS